MSDVVEGTATDLPPFEEARPSGPEVPDAPQDTPPQEELHAVVVVRSEDAEGNISVDVVPHGNVKADQVQTLLELAVPSWRKKIGLSK